MDDKALQAGIAAGFICYNPDPDRFQKALEAVLSQAEKVYVADNASSNQKELALLLEKASAPDRIVFLPGQENRGISEVLDDLLNKASQENMTWLLSMDQDSVLEAGALEKMAQTGVRYGAAAVGPLVRDVRRKNETPPIPENLITETDFCITSGCLMNVEKILAAGGVDRYLFIGFVDTELCHRLRLRGEKICCDHRVLLDHELGRITPSRLGKMWLFLAEKLRLPGLGKLSYHREVSPLRVYYATRNALYLEGKYQEHPHPSFSEKWAVRNGISCILRGKEKLRIAKAFRQGMKDGKVARDKAGES